MLEPVETLPDTSAEVSVEESVQSKPVRKRAPKKLRVGVAKGMRIQIKPTPEQAVKLAQWAGASRWLWNWALAKQHAHYAQHQKSLGCAALSRELTQLMSEDPELSWLSIPPRTCHTQTLNNLAAGWQHFFDGLSGKRPDKPGQPVFHCRVKRKTVSVFKWTLGTNLRSRFNVGACAFLALAASRPCSLSRCPVASRKSQSHKKQANGLPR